MSKKDKARIEALETRLARLEALLIGAPGAAGDTVPGPGDANGARLRLDLRTGGDGDRDGADWRRDSPLAALRAADWPGCAVRLAALGHPLRLAILRRALDGPIAAAALLEGDAAGPPPPSNGQLYHHLRELTATGWLEGAGRGRFALPEGRRGPLLAALALALVD